MINLRIFGLNYLSANVGSFYININVVKMFNELLTWIWLKTLHNKPCGSIRVYGIHMLISPTNDLIFKTSIHLESHTKTFSITNACVMVPILLQPWDSINAFTFLTSQQQIVRSVRTTSSPQKTPLITILHHEHEYRRVNAMHHCRKQPPHTLRTRSNSTHHAKSTEKKHRSNLRRSSSTPTDF